MHNKGEGLRGEPTSYELPPPGAQGYSPTESVRPDAGAGASPVTFPVASAGAGDERLVGGRYRLVARLGHGGMGTVWRAYDTVVEREVAVKEPRLPDEMPDEARRTMYERMRREARTAARLAHPSVVTIHDVVVENGQPWIVMELVDGQSLGDVLEEGILDPREAARIGLAVAGALDAAHRYRKAVLHRDVKPDNILLGEYDRVILTDFGIAQVDGEQRLTETGAFIGSPEFIAPERVLGQRPGPESDLWALGVVLYRAIEGVSPFRRSHTPATLQAVLNAKPQTPARASEPLAALIMRLLSKEPSERPGADEVKRVLAAASRPQGIPRPPGLLARVLSAFVARLRGSRGLRFGTGGAVLAVAAALVLVIAQPFGGGLPDGWQERDESKQLKATVAVPGDYKRTEDDGLVVFTDKNERYRIEITRGTEGTESAVGEANSRVAWYKDEFDNGYEYEEVGDDSVTSLTYEGKDAAEISAQFVTGSDHPLGEGRKMRVRELVYVNGSGAEWHLVLEAPDMNSDATKKSRQYFDDLVAHFGIDEKEL